MKKSLWLLLLLLALLLAGCGKKQTVGLCTAQADGYAGYLAQTLTQAGYSVITEDSALDQAVQLAQVASLLEKGCDALLIQPVMASQTGALEALAGEARVPVVFFGNKPETIEKSCYIGPEPASAGSVQGQLPQAFAQGCDLNGDGTLAYCVIAGSQDHLDAQLRTQGLTQSAQGDCLEIVYTDWSRETGETACAKLLQTWGKDIEAVFCNDETLALGAMSAIEAGGREVNGDIYLFAVGDSRQTYLRIRSGDLSGTAARDYAAMARQTLEAVRLLLRGGAPEPLTEVAWIPVTPDTVEAYID